MRVLIAVVLGVASLGPVAHADDWTVTRDPFDRAVIARYKQLLARDPHDRAFDALAALYRRHRTLDVLRDEYAEAASHDDWAALVITGRIARLAKDEAAAVAPWTRAVAQRPDDVHTWFALGELHRSANRPADARASFTQVVDWLGVPVARFGDSGLLAPARTRPAPKLDRGLRAMAITAHTALAALAGDPEVADAHHRALIALEPAQVRHRLARGDALLAASSRERAERALEVFREAEPMLDPAWRAEAITRQATALTRLERHAEARRELERALARAPRGSGLAHDVTRQIIDSARRDRTLPALLARYETAWQRRGAFEWSMLGELHAELGAREVALAAFDQAATQAPRELAPQRRAIEILDALGRRAEATARLEALATKFPRDIPLHLELARRLWPSQRDRAIVQLLELGERMPRDLGAQLAVADQYIQWARPELAVPAYQRVVALDPSYTGSLALALAQALDRDGLVALAAKQRDADSIATVAAVMLDYAMWKHARNAYSRAIELAPRRADLFAARAGAYEGLEQWRLAADDAATALALTVDPTALAAKRHVVVRNAMRLDKREAQWGRWREQLARDPDHRDLPALLDMLATRAELDAETRLAQLEQVARRVPDELGVMVELVELYSQTQRFIEGIAVLRKLEKLPGMDVAVIRRRIAHFQSDAYALRNDEEWKRQLLTAGEPEPAPARPDAAVQSMRFGARLGIGTASHQARSLGLGIVTTLQLGGSLSGLARLDWVETVRPDGQVRTIGGSVGLATRLATTPNALWSVGAALRLDTRHGALRGMPGAMPIGLAGEGLFELTSRHTPFGLGLRLGRFVDGGTAAHLDLVLEWR